MEKQQRRNDPILAETTVHKVNLWAPFRIRINSKYSFIRLSFIFDVIAYAIFLIFGIFLFLVHEIFWQLRVYGRENLKLIKGKGAVTVSNHVHPLDVTMIGVTLFPRKVYFSGQQNPFKTPVIRLLIRMLGAFPLPVSVVGFRKMMDDIKKALARGRLVHIYPEVAMWPYHRPIRPFKDGAFYFAVLNDAPMLPMVFVFNRKSRYNKARLIICKPVMPVDCLTEPHGKISHRDHAILLRDHVREIMQRTEEDYYITLK